MRHITPLQPNIIRYLVEQNKWTELTNHIMDLQSRVGLLEVIVADQEWRPIETAPKDGTEVLTYNEISGIHQVSWSRGNRYGHWETERWLDKETNWVIDPSHWMPLPKDPTR